MIDMSPLIHAQNETDFETQFQKLMKYPNETWKNLANSQQLRTKVRSLKFCRSEMIDGRISLVD